jgi:hypothetical protein
MPFDIHLFDKLNPELEASWELLEDYSDTLLEEFFASPEGVALLQQYPDAGFWSDQLIEYGYNYIGVPLTKMRRSHAEELLSAVFPRKISLSAPDEADVAIPELKAFWRYLQREYKLGQADAILALLDEVGPNFRRWMNDPSKFGMAKSLFMGGQAAGFDMTNEAEAGKFFAAYNARLLAGETPGGLPELPPPFGGFRNGDFADRDLAGAGYFRTVTRTDKDKKKKRKAAEASRRRNRKRK